MMGFALVTGPCVGCGRIFQRGHPFDEINTVWRKSGKRMCRECNRLRDRGAIHAI